MTLIDQIGDWWKGLDHFKKGLIRYTSPILAKLLDQAQKDFENRSRPLKETPQRISQTDK